MKTLCAILAASLSIISSVGPTSAQRYYESGPDYDYRYRQRDYDYRDRYDDRERYEYRDRGPRYRNRAYAFDEREYLRCNPDVRRSVYRGEIASGAEHYLQFGRREGRALSC